MDQQVQLPDLLCAISQAYRKVRAHLMMGLAGHRESVVPDQARRLVLDLVIISRMARRLVRHVDSHRAEWAGDLVRVDVVGGVVVDGVVDYRRGRGRGRGR